LAKHVKKEVFANLDYHSCAKETEDSYFWSGLMKVKESFLSLGHLRLNNGENIRFWEDK
jgi:hypothetical protein